MTPTLSLTIDYYAGTKDYATDPLVWFGEMHPDWIDLRGRNGYLRRMQEAFTGVEFLYHPERHEMGAHLELSGTTLIKFLGCHPFLDPADALDKSGVTAYKATRIDVAIDIPDAGLYAREFYNKFASDPRRVGRRKVTLFNSIGEGGGKTTYVGSRTSPLYLRVYDKDAQSKGKQAVSRIEFELKGVAAKAAQLALWRDHVSLDRVAASLLLNVGTEWDNQLLQDLIVGASIAKWEVRPLTETDTQKWLTRQVLPTLIKDALENGYPLLLDWLYELTWERIKTSQPPNELDL